MKKAAKKISKKKAAKKAAKKVTGPMLFSLNIGEKFTFKRRNRVYTIVNSTPTKVIYTGFGARYTVEKNVPVTRVK
jgi:hypothetical protein